MILRVGVALVLPPDGGKAHQARSATAARVSPLFMRYPEILAATLR